MRLGFFILLAIFCSCGPSKHEQLVHSGQQAEKNEQWVQAALAYGNACRVNPAKIAVCKRAQEMRDYAVEIRSFRALQQCHAGQLQRCLTEIEPVRAFRTTKFEKIAAVLATAGKVATTQCSARPGTELSGALTQLQCLQHWRKPLWEDSDYRQGFISHSEYVSTSLSQRAMALPQQAGARVSYLEAAACVAPIPSDAKRLLASSAEEFARRSATEFRLQLKVEGRTSDASGICHEIAAALGRGLHCGGTAPSTLNLSAEIHNRLPRWNHSHSDTTRTKRYLAGTEQVVNPNYDRVRLEYEMAENRVRDAKEEVQDRESRCNETESSSDCNSHQSALRTLDQRERDLSRARDRFNSEPAMITKDVYKDHQYTVRTHNWRAPFRASIQLDRSQPSREGTDITYSDSEHPGFSLAGISADPLVRPSDRYFMNQSSSWLYGRLRTRAVSEMHRRADVTTQNCGRDNAVDCWTTAQFWRGTTSFGLLLIKSISESQNLVCTADIL